MKKIVVLASCLIVFFGFSNVALAQGKIAVFSPQEAIMGSNTAKSRIKIMLNSSTYNKKKKRFEALKKQGEDLIKKVQADADVMSKNKKDEIRKQLQAKEKELEGLAVSLKEQELKVNQALMKEMAPRLERAVKQVIKAENIGLLLDRNAVVHAEPSFDVTQAVIKRLNQ